MAMASLWYAPTDPSPTDYFSVAAIGCTLASMRFVQAPLRVFYILVYLFLIANILSLFVAHVPSHALSNLTTMVFLFFTLITYPTIAANLSPRHMTVIHSAVIFAGTMAGTIGVLAQFRLLPGPDLMYFSSERGIRLSPFFQDPNVYSPFLCFAFAMALTLFWETKKTLLAFAVIVPILVSIMLSFSRAGWVNLMVTGAIFLFLTIFVQKDRAAKRKFVIFSATALSVAIIAFPIMAELTGAEEMLRKRSQIQHYDTHRFAAQEIALSTSIEHPFGIGPGHASGRYHFPQSKYPVDPHSIYLKILVERGWLGFVSFFGIIGYCFISGFRALRGNPVRARYIIALLAALTGIMVNTLVISAIHWRHLYIVIGLLLAEIVLWKKTQAQNAKVANPPPANIPRLGVR
jgi:O-antigen ligase